MSRQPLVLRTNYYMKTLFRICLFVLLISACRTPESSLLSEYFNTSKLPAQSFIINPDVDTSIVTNGGVRINITKGSFDSNKPVTVEWKEALQFNDMLRAGLLTQSGKDILSSSGMFYLNTKENVSIKKPIGIEVPTNNIVQGMQLYKGDSSDGKIDWQDPKPIENIKAFGDNVLGKALFNGNCVQCHGLQNAGTGPALAGITQRKSRQWLYAMTRNTAAVMVIDPYLRCEKCKYGVVMQNFPLLSDETLDSLYDYIEDETERLGLTGKIKNNSCDSCAILNSTYDSLLGIYNKLFVAKYLQRDSSIFGKLDSAVNQVNYQETEENSDDMIEGKEYYRVNIQSEGWYNIDALFKEQIGASPSKLIVKPQGERNQQMEYYLAIPALKILVEGGTTATGDNVIFYDEDGSIPLPQSRQAFVIAVGGTEENYYFSKTTFIISSEQTINLRIQKMSEQQFKAQLTELSYYGLTSSVTSEKAYQEDSGQANNSVLPPTTNSRYEKPLTLIEKQLQNLASKKSKNCGCDTYPLASASKDTSSAILPEQTSAPRKRLK